jgi:hypothetical protein
MAPRSITEPAVDLDALRLLALSRIPRCGGCHRFEALVDAHDHGPGGYALPAVPNHCRHQVCAPLASRWCGSATAKPVRRLSDTRFYHRAS